MERLTTENYKVYDAEAQEVDKFENFNDFRTAVIKICKGSLTIGTQIWTSTLSTFAQCSCFGGIVTACLTSCTCGKNMNFFK